MRKDFFGSFDYCGDGMMAEFLQKNGTPFSLHGVYGLLHGCAAATHNAPPSTFLPVIFHEFGFESEEEADTVLKNLMGLWNQILSWSPDIEEFSKPKIDIPHTLDGLQTRLGNWNSLVKNFIKGLDLGETEETDFSEDAVDALKSLVEAEVFLENGLELFEKGKAKENEVRDVVENLKKLEDIMGDCIARINLGLHPARLRAAGVEPDSVEFDRKPQPVRSVRIGRNDPCPCGSGKKYKKCCGLVN